MSEVLFDDKNLKPDDALLSEKLGASYIFWVEIKDHIKEQYGEITQEWKFYGKKYGWQLKTFLKKRNLFFLIPYESFYKIGFIFGDKAVKQIESSEISNKLIKEILGAKKYAEGRGLAIDVKDNTFISDIKKLIDIKIKN